MLNNLIDSDTPEITWAASMARSLENQYNKKEITIDEYTELLEDIVNDKRITSLANTLKEKIELEEAIDLLIQVATQI